MGNHARIGVIFCLIDRNKTTLFAHLSDKGILFYYIGKRKGGGEEEEEEEEKSVTEYGALSPSSRFHIFFKAMTPGAAMTPT